MVTVDRSAGLIRARPAEYRPENGCPENAMAQRVFDRDRGGHCVDFPPSDAALEPDPEAVAVGRLMRARMSFTRRRSSPTASWLAPRTLWLERLSRPASLI